MSRRTWQEISSVKQHVDGTYQLYSSSCHNHQQRADSNRLLSPIRDDIRQMTDNGLTAVQIKKVMKVLHPDLFIDSKIKSAVEYKHQQNCCRIKFIEELYSWCSQRNIYPSVDKIHDVFVPYFE
ncbi:unnamed protein product, partial [Didymodactylos carnosus]